MVVGHNPTAHSLSQGLLTARDKKGSPRRCGTASPPAALGVYAFRAVRWADVAHGDGQAGRPDGAAYGEG